MAQFSTNESVSLDKTIDNSRVPIQTNSDDIERVYELEKCIEWIKKHDYKKVCLQFPDYLLPDSCEVTTRLQKRIGHVVYIMGDSAYESCCVDYVTAQHVSADAIIHFGPRCLSLWTESIPCLCIYEKHDIDLDQFLLLFTKKFENDTDIITVILDTPYIHIQDELIELLKHHNNTLVLNINNTDFQTDERTLVYIGQNNRKLLNFQLKYKAKYLYYFDPEDKEPLIKNYIENNVILKRRNFLIEKIKDSQTVGIIIGTVVIKNFIKAIDRIKTLLKLHKKSYYLISVGRPTVAKLANFPEMDIYVLICCSMSDVFESRDFYKPIVTAFDVEMALNPKKNLDFSYDLDLNYLDDEIEDCDLSKPDVSLLSGNIRCNENNREEIGCNGDKTVAIKDEGTVVRSDKSGAGFLASRTFKGLEQNLGQTEVKLAEDGRKGVPQQYENEIF